MTESKYETISLTKPEQIPKVRHFLNEYLYELSYKNVYSYDTEKSRGFCALLTKEVIPVVKLDKNYERFEELKKGVQNLVA